MKQTLFSIVVSSLLALTASAQDEATLRNDPTYSPHNYKHPNKAAAARKWANKTGVAVPAPGYTQESLANYKQQKPGVTPARSLSVAHTPTNEVTLRNYKVQRVSLSPESNSPGSMTASKPLTPSVPEGD